MQIFITFADSDMRKSLSRISAQAVAMNTFDRIHAFNERDLDISFRRRHAAVLKRGTRGFGYWCWKPQIILQTLASMRENDLLLYADAGCHLNPKGVERLQQYFALANESPSGIVAFQPGKPLWRGVPNPKQYRTDMRSRCWVKGDLLDHLNVRRRKDILDAPMITAGVQIIRKTQRSQEMIADWLGVIEHDFALVDDSRSRSANLPQFIEHRHDQAIYSILAMLRGIETVSMFECWYPNADGSGPDWSVLEHFPIHAKRDKAILPGLRHRLRRAMTKAVSRATQRAGLSGH